MGDTSTAAADRRPPRERLLAAADELFYEGGVHSVGIDRVIERAGVAKASLYSAFGSKDELIRAYLSSRFAARRARIERKLAPLTAPRARILGVFDALDDLIAEPGFRGCAFINASAETTPGSSVEQLAAEARTWLRSLFHDLAQEAGATDPDGLAQQLTLLYDGATVTAQMDHNREAAITARTIAAALLDAATRPS